MSLTQPEAQHIIRKLGESGIPPTRGLEAYTVGIDSLLGTLEEEYLRGYLRDGGSSFKLIVGEYGSGKSHFLYRLFVRQRRVSPYAILLVITQIFSNCERCEHPRQVI